MSIVNKQQNCTHYLEFVKSPLMRYSFDSMPKRNLRFQSSRRPLQRIDPRTRLQIQTNSTGGRFSSQILLCSQILLSIFCGKFFSSDGKFFFQFENQETLFSSFKNIIFIFFFQSSFNLRSTKLYFLLSVFF